MALYTALASEERLLADKSARANPFSEQVAWWLMKSMCCKGIEWGPGLFVQPWGVHEEAAKSELMPGGWEWCPQSICDNRPIHCSTLVKE